MHWSCQLFSLLHRSWISTHIITVFFGNIRLVWRGPWCYLHWQWESDSDISCHSTRNRWRGKFKGVASSYYRIIIIWIELYAHTYAHQHTPQSPPSCCICPRARLLPVPSRLQLELSCCCDLKLSRFLPSPKRVVPQVCNRAGRRSLAHGRRGGEGAERKVEGGNVW